MVRVPPALRGGRKRGRRTSGIARQRSRAGIVLTLPAFAVVVVLLIIPIGEAVYYSMTNWDGITAHWVGPGTYVHLVQSPTFWRVLENNGLLLLALPIAVFIPLLLMGGIVGRLFREFAVTLSTSILVSMIISLTTTPMMCAYLLKGERAAVHGRLYTHSERAFGWMLSTYRRSLMWVLDKPATTLVVLVLTIVLNAVLIIIIPKGFFPVEDTGAIAGAVQGPQDSSFPAMNAALQRIAGVIKADPAVAHVISFTGNSGATNTGFMYVALKPLAERHANVSQIIARLRPQLNRLPVASAFLQAVQDLRIGGRSSNALYQYTIQSSTLHDLTRWGPTLLAKMKGLPGLLDVSSDQQNGGL